MPALPPVPKVLRIVNETTDGNDLRAISRVYFQYTGAAPTAAQLNILAGAADTAWTGNMAPIYLAGNTHLGHVIEDLTSATSAVGSSTAATAGTRAGSAMAAGTALVVSFAISRRYRGGHPRMYLAAGGSGDLSTRQTWGGAFLAAANAAAQGYLDAIAAAVWAGGGVLGQVNVSYYQGFTPFRYPSGRYRNIPNLRVGGPIVDAVNSVSASPKVGSQRRRNLQSV